MNSDTTRAGAPAAERPRFGFWAIWNMCFGFLGLQFAFGLQNANVSRIFQTLGANLDDIPALWIAAPFTGLVVQPLIGYYSDRTWGRFGRRRPYFVAGALLTGIALVAMPFSPALWVAAVLLWLLDASINISMEPFRAFVGDQLPPSQRAGGYAMQSFFIGIGAVLSGLLPWLLERMGVSNHGMDAAGHAIVTDTVRWSFLLGAAVLVAAMGWTILRTREYPPAELAAHALAEGQPVAADAASAARPEPGSPLAMAAWLVAGGALAALVAAYRLDKQLYMLAGGLLAWGIAQLAWRIARPVGMFGTIMDDMHSMPDAMRRLVPVQFFSWVALFAMWIYTTPAVTAVHFHSSDPASDAYNEGATWVSVLFGAYNGFAALAALVIPAVARRLGLRATHALNLLLGAAGFFSVALVRDPHWLLASMVGVGIAWASILSLPYALLSDSVPAQKMGLYMGIFNFFIVIPQLLAATVLGFVLKMLFDSQPIMALVIGGASFVVAALLALRVPQPRA
jgi:maltose/moltooligosaccharide transporter